MNQKRKTPQIHAPFLVLFYLFLEPFFVKLKPQRRTRQASEQTGHTGRAVHTEVSSQQQCEKKLVHKMQQCSPRYMNQNSQKWSPGHIFPISQYVLQLSQCWSWAILRWIYCIIEPHLSPAQKILQRVFVMHFSNTFLPFIILRTLFTQTFIFSVNHNAISFRSINGWLDVYSVLLFS